MQGCVDPEATQRFLTNFSWNLWRKTMWITIFHSPHPMDLLVINSSHLMICSKSGKGRTRSSLFLSILALYFLTKLSLNNAFYFFNHITFHFSHHDFNYCHGFSFFCNKAIFVFNISILQLFDCIKAKYGSLRRRKSLPRINDSF